MRSKLNNLVSSSSQEKQSFMQSLLFEESDDSGTSEDESQEFSPSPIMKAKKAIPHANKTKRSVAKLVESKMEHKATKENIVDVLRSQSILQKGKVHICVSEFLHVLQHFYSIKRNKKLQDFIEKSAHKHLFKKLILKGNARKNGIRFKCNIEVEILDLEKFADKNILIPSRSTSPAMSALLSMSSRTSHQGQLGDRWFFVELIPNVSNKVVLHSWSINPNKDENDGQHLSSQNDTLHNETKQYIGIHNGSIVMLSNIPGAFVIHLDISIPYEHLRSGAGFSSHSLNQIEEICDDKCDSEIIDHHADDEKNQSRQIKLPIPKSLQTQMYLEIVTRDNIQFKAQDSLNTEVVQMDFYGKKSRKKDQNNKDKVQTSTGSPLYRYKISSSLPPSNSLQLQWTITSSPQLSEFILEELQNEKEEKKMEEKKLPLIVNNEQNSLHAFGEGMIQTTCIINYSINNGSITELNVNINHHGRPFRVVNVIGNGIKDWQLIKPSLEEDTRKKTSKDSDIQVLHIQFNYGMENSYKLVIHTELNMASTSTPQTIVPTFSCIGVNREKGHLAIVARTSIEIKENSRKYLARIDPSELPSILRSSTRFPILFAYRYLEKDYLLDMKVTRHDDVEVLSSVAQLVKYELNHAGFSSDYSQHMISLHIKNNAKQFLRIKLPDNHCEIWSVMVDGKSVKPAQESSKNDQVYVLIPLSSSSSRSSNTTSVVKFVFLQANQKLTSTSGRAVFTFAQFDCPVQVLELKLFLAKECWYGEFDGDLIESEQISDFPVVRTQSLLKRGVFSVSFDAGANFGSEFGFTKYLLLENNELNLSVGYKRKTKSFWKQRSLNPSTRILKSMLVMVLIVLCAILYIKFIPLFFSKSQ